MPTYENIARPNEWITETDRQFAAAIRKWVDEDVWPNRHDIDEDWQEHKIIKPIMKKRPAQPLIAIDWAELTGAD